MDEQELSDPGSKAEREILSHFSFKSRFKLISDSD
jgi:hypothetical protein